MRSTWYLSCVRCEAEHPDGYVGRCEACESPVVAKRRRGTGFTIDQAAPGLWQYAQMLGLSPSRQNLSLGEAMPPVVALQPPLGEEYEVYLQLEHLNPTGSFKDRAVAAATVEALEAERTGIVCASSGNAAASAAAYAARAGLPVVIIVPESTPEGKLAASAAYGAQQVTVRGDYSRSFAAAELVAQQLGYTNVTTTYINPYGVAALRSVAYDMYRRLCGAPDAVVVPTSAGPLVHGVAEGFAELRSWGLVETVPRLIAVQPEGCAPIARAWGAGEKEVKAWEAVDTRVSGLDDPLRGYSGDGTLTLSHIRSSAGAALSVTDDEAEGARSLLAETSGVDAEPAGAVSVAALARLRQLNLLNPGDRVVCLITGSGLKRPRAAERPPLEAADPGQVIDLLSSQRR